MSDDEDRFWAFIESAIFPEDRWLSASAEVEHLIKLLNVGPGATFLDLPCGPGRHSIELAKRGFGVVACDRTRSYVEKARTRATQEGINVDWQVGDMREFIPPRPVDVVINLYTSFGYFRDLEDDRRAARRFFEALRPGGRLVIETMGKEMLGPIFRERAWQEMPNGSLLLHERKFTDHFSWIQERWIAIRGVEREERTFEHRLYSARELVDLLSSVGFVEISSYGSLGGGDYGYQAKQLVVVARRPG